MQEAKVQGVAAQLESIGSIAYSTLFPTTTALQLAPQSSQPVPMATSAPFTAQSGMQQSLAGAPALEDSSLQHQYLSSPNPPSSSQLTYFPTMQQQHQQQQHSDVISAVPAPLVQQQAPQLALWAEGSGQEYQQHMQQIGEVKGEVIGGCGEVIGLAGDQRGGDAAQADQAAVAAYKQWSNNYEAQLVSRLSSGQYLLYCSTLSDVHTWHTA